MTYYDEDFLTSFVDDEEGVEDDNEEEVEGSEDEDSPDDEFEEG